MSSPYFSSPHLVPGPPPKRRKPGGLIFLVGLVTLCGVAGAVLAIVLLGSQPAEEKPAEAAQEEPAPVAAVPMENGAVGQPPPVAVIEPLEDGPAEVVVNLATTPPGAEVFSAGESIGTTPIRRHFEKGERKETWQIFLDGYEVVEVEVAMDADFLSEVVLNEVAPDKPVVRPKGATAKTAAGAAKTGDSSGKTASTRKAGTRRNSSGKDRTPKPGGKRGEKEHKVITGTTGAAIPD